MTNQDHQKIAQLEEEAGILELTNGEEARQRLHAVQRELAETRLRCTITQAVEKEATVLLQAHERYDRGPVQCVETGIVYESAAAAAYGVGCGRSAMSNHLAGRHPHIRGKHFKRVQEVN